SVMPGYTFSKWAQGSTSKSTSASYSFVTDIIIDYSAETQVTVVIPEFSPDGDKVTKVEMQDLNTLATLNVPVLITEEGFNKIKNTLKEIETDDRDVKRFISFYDPHEQDGIYVLEPLINEAEYNRISDILKNAGYTSQDAYDAAVEVVNTVPASSDEAVALRLQAFDYFYHSANKIKCIIVPEGTEVIGIESLLVSYHTVDAD
ncbi:MAG: hypothetical protein IIW63_07510, partial [Clostridia bacterium]|nr:hypothetical protein [Clostridia bacterium]